MQFIINQCSQISNIDGFIHISGLEAATDENELDFHQITHILNLTDEQYNSGKRKYKRLITIDNTTQNIKQYFSTVFDYLESAKQEQGKVLIHCQYGMSRSVSFGIAWMLKQSHDQGQLANYDEALKTITSVRAMAAPNPSFKCQLEELAAELNTSLLSYPANEKEHRCVIL